MSNVLSSQPEQNAKPVTLLAPMNLYDSFFLADEHDTVYVSQRELKEPMIVVHINEKRGHAFLMNIRGTLKKPIRVEIVDLIDAVESSELLKGETFQSTQSKTLFDQFIFKISYFIYSKNVSETSTKFALLTTFRSKN